MKEVQQGDLQKMGLLYERHRREVFAYFYRCTADRSQSEDLVQSVFLRLIKYRHTFTGEGQFVYWLFATARNAWYDEHRKKDPLKHKDAWPQQEDVQDHDQPDFYVERQERRHIVQQALQRLSAEKREAIVLSRFHGLKYHEIAVIAHCSENAIKSRVQRGLLELKNLMEHIEM